MKKLMILGLLILAIGLLGYTCWEENGKAIRQETNLNYSGAVIHLSGGGYMLMWSDASGGLQEMKVQKVSADGENIWAEPVILTTRECYYPNGEVLGETSDGDIVAAWYELGDPALLRVQKIDTTGNLLWGETGLIFELAQEEWECFPLRVTADEDGGAYLVWLEDHTPNEIKCLYVNGEGEVPSVWNGSGNLLFNCDYYSHEFSVVPDGFGGIVVAARFEMGDIHLQRCDNQAILHWGAEGIMIESSYIYDYHVTVLPWSVGEYTIIVELEGGFWANILDYNGNFQFNEMQNIASINGEDRYEIIKGVKTSDDKLGMIFTRNENQFSYIHTQKTQIGEEPDWGSEGILLGTSEDDSYADITLSADEAGGLTLAWGELGDETYNIFYQHLDSEGNAISGTGPQLAGISQDSRHTLKMFCESDSSVLFWQQYQEDRNEIQVQIYDEDDNAQIAGMGNTVLSVLAGSTGVKYILKTQGAVSAVCWRDDRYPKRQIYVQMINNDTGELFYIANGMPATVNVETEYFSHDICLNEAGTELCIAYQFVEDNFIGGGIQIIDQDGNRLMGESGEIFECEFDFTDYGFGNAGNNSYLFLWCDQDETFRDPRLYLKAQKIENHQFVWGSGITLLEGYEGDCSHLMVEYPYIFWIRNEFPPSQLRLTRLADDGSAAPGWSNEGHIVSTSFLRGNLKLSKYGSDIIVFWIAPAGTEEQQLKGQRYNPEGEMLWEEDGRIFGEVCEDFYDYQLEGEYLYYLIQEADNPFILYKYNLNGESAWEEGITFESEISMNYCYFSAWEEVLIVYGNTIDGDIYAKIYNSDGNLVDNIPENGLEVCTQPHWQNIEACVTDQNGSSIALWQDRRGEYMPMDDPSLYVQKIDLSTVPITDEEIIDGNLLNVSNYPNPFTRSTTLKCDLPRSAEDAEIVIYNIKGQKVRSLPATSNEVQWDCRNQAGNIAGSGVYFYVLQGKNIKSETGKMIMLR